jgi:hypothetical protein
MGELEFTIASSNLGQYLALLIDNLNSKVEVEPEVLIDGGDVFVASNDDDVFGSGVSVFNSPTLAEKESTKSSRSRKKKRKDSDDGGGVPPFAVPSDDPFA